MMKRPYRGLFSSVSPLLKNFNPRFLILLLIAGCLLCATPARADIVTGLMGHWKLDGNARDYSGKGIDFRGFRSCSINMGMA